MDTRGAIISMFLALVFYVLILSCYRLMGKREINQLGIFDFVVNLIIADVAATGIVQEEYWLDSILGLVVLVALQIAMAKFQIKKPFIRNKIDGEPSLIIKNGAIDYSELAYIRIQLDELMMLLRQYQVVAIEEVQYAVIEANGKLSIYEKKFPTKLFPIPIIVSGIIKPRPLRSLGKNKEWLEKELQNLSINIDDIKLVFYEKDNLIIHTKDDLIKHRHNQH